MLKHPRQPDMKRGHRIYSILQHGHDRIYLAVAAVSLDRKLTSLNHSSYTSSGGSGIRYLYIIVKLVSIKGRIRRQNRKFNQPARASHNCLHFIPVHQDRRPDQFGSMISEHNSNTRTALSTRPSNQDVHKYPLPLVVVAKQG